MHAYPKAIRLRHRLEFRRTLDHGNKTVGRLVVAFSCGSVAQSADAAPSGPRLGLIVSRKVGNAVTRNRVKRHLREAFRRTHSELASAVCRSDIVLIARPGAGAASSAELAKALSDAIARLGRRAGAP